MIIVKGFVGLAKLNYLIQRIAALFGVYYFFQLIDSEFLMCGWGMWGGIDNDTKRLNPLFISSTKVWGRRQW